MGRFSRCVFCGRHVTAKHRSRAVMKVRNSSKVLYFCNVCFRRHIDELAREKLLGR